MECPICKSVDIRKDFDYPETMMNCKICGIIVKIHIPKPKGRVNINGKNNGSV